MDSASKKTIFKKCGFWTFAVIAIAGCAAAMTPAQQSYMTKVSAAPTTFRIPKNQSDNAWQRAQVFVSKYSSMKIQTSTNNVLQTYNPTGALSFGYNINRLDMGDSTEFSISGTTSNPFAHDKANNNSHICADYVASGELPFPELINH